MTALALTAPAVPSSPSSESYLSGLWSWFVRVGQSVAMTSAERELRAAFDLAVRICADTVWLAADKTDLERRLNDAVVDPSAQHVLAELGAKAIALGIDLTPPPVGTEIQITDEAKFRYGAGSYGPLDRAMRTHGYLAALLVLVLDEQFQKSMGAVADGPPARLSPSAAAALLHGRRSNVLMLAVLGRLVHQRNVEPWLALAVAEAAESSSYEMLRFLCSFPGLGDMVPSSVVPPADRFAMEDLEAELEEEDRVIAEATAAHGVGDDAAPRG